MGLILGTVLGLWDTELLFLGTAGFMDDDWECLGGTLGVWRGCGSCTQCSWLPCNGEVTIEKKGLKHIISVANVNFYV